MIVNYASENGRPYSSLGKAMRSAGIDERYINLQGIKEYFTLLRPDLWEVFSNLNESYVFFKRGDLGPYGYSGAILTPKHSIAVDKFVFPMGAVGLIQTERPDQVVGDQVLSWKRFAQFVVAQDTGGAIRSPGRVDVFWGEGPYAEVAAGKTDRTGRLIFFLAPLN
jgi:membrane-bound lytic murein transglycosylase A